MTLSPICPEVLQVPEADESWVVLEPLDGVGLELQALEREEE